MSSRYKDWQSQSSSLPRRYYSLPRDYSSQDGGSRTKDSTYLSRHRTTSTSGTTPTQSWRYGGSRTFGASSDASSTSDIKASATRRAGNSAVSSLGASSYARKGSFSRDKGSSLPSSPTRTQETLPLYTARHVSSLPLRNSISQKSSWGPDSPPIRQRSSSSLRESYSWDPGSAPVRQHSSSSLREKPFGLASSRRKYSSSRDNTSDDARKTPREMPTPLETTSKRSPSTVYYEGSQLKSETPPSPVSPTALRYGGSIPYQGPVSSKSDVTASSSPRRGSGSSLKQKQEAGSDNGVKLEDACTARDISLISREITSAYEGSLSRSDSRKGKNLLLAKEERSPKKEKVETVEKSSSKDVTKKVKEGGKTAALGRGRKSSRGKSPDNDLDGESHRRSSSVGSATSKDEGKTKADKHFAMKSGFFSRKKSRDSTDSEGEEDRRQRKGAGLFPRKKGGDPVKESQTQQGSTSSSPSLSPTLTPPRRKISGPSRFFFSSGDSKATSDVSKKKFSVPGKYFPSKDLKSGGESSDNVEAEPERLSRERLRRRVSFPGMLSFPRSSSAEHTSVGPDPLLDPELLDRRRNMKKALSFDSSKVSMLQKLRFWDKSPDSRSRSTSPDDDRSRLQSLAGDASVEKRTSQLRKSRERMPRRKSSEEKETSEEHGVRSAKDKPKIGTLSLNEKSQVSEVETVPSSDATVGSVQKPVKEPKVRYVGSVEPPLPSELRAKRRAQYKVNSIDRESQLSTTSATEQKANSTNSDTVKRDSDQPVNLEDNSTRDTVSKLRERRRKRKEERERFFAGLIPTLENNTTKDAILGNEVIKEPDINKAVKEKSPVVTQDAVDGKFHSEEKKLVERNGLIRSKCIADDTSVRRPPQLADIGRKHTVDDMSNRERIKSGKPRYQTIASSVHADIIADLIRERGLKTVDAEVKIPSVAELRAKFLISKDDNKVIPPRPVIRLEDRPHSICGETLSPTEMRKFDEVNFSLAKRVSSDKIDAQNSSDSSTASLSIVAAETNIPCTETNQQGLSSSPKIESLKKEVKIQNKIQEEDLDKEQRDLSPESDIKKKRGSKKKRKKSLFGGDKEVKGLEEENDMPQTGAVSAAIKAMFSRRGSVDKSKISRKQRARTLGSDGQPEAIKAALSAKERKKSLPEHIAAKSSAVNESHTNVIPKKEVKHERTEESREYGKEKGTDKNILGKDKDVEIRQVHGKDKNLERKPHAKDRDTERKVHSKDKDIESKVSPKHKDVERKLSSKDKEFERKGSTKNKDMERKGSIKDKDIERRGCTKDKCIVGNISTNNMNIARNVSAKDADVELQLVTDVEMEKTAVKEKKSLKKPSKNKKRKFSSSLKPFSMMKTKSESNLAQRFDFLTVDIPLETEELEKQDKGEKEEGVMLEQVCDKPGLQVVSPPPVPKERRRSVFEEGLREFYETKADQRGRDLEAPAPEPCKFEITLEDLDAISEQTSGQLTSLAENRMKIRPKRHHRTKSNPVRSLQNRDDIRTDTEVDKPRIEKKPVTSEHPVIRRKKKKYKDPDNLYRRHTLDLAASALAGLASTEDFTKVLLRKTAGPNEKDEFRGTKPTMLIHIKGRRHLQVRLVEPCHKSLNSGDCFALVTEKDLFSWIGKDCNPYEKAKVTEIVSKIKTKGELDCKARDIVTIEEGDEDNNATLDKFWKILSGDTDAKIKDAQSLPRDEEYEKGVVKGNMVYKIHWTDPPSLMAVESMCGHLPQVSILDTKEVFVFDFGSELYVWNGQQSLSGQRKSAFALARQLYEEPFKPYRNYDPIFPYGKADNTIMEVDNKNTYKRPPWTLFARLHEKAETILFREKFLDWPDPTKIIKMKGHPSCLELAPKPSPPVELKPCDVKMMVQEPSPLQCPTFEGVNVGRGNGVPTVWVGDVYREGNLVTTVGLTVWHINEYRHFELPSSHFGNFHSGEGYVVRWAYFVLADRVVKDRKSRCRSTVAGRVRCAYFFWQGNDCSVNEKGAAAIMAVELDEEKGPQVRVVQGKESPVFLNLFKGGMIIHNGRKKVDDTAVTFSDTSTIRLYVTRNEEPGEACINQVKANSYSLRSRTSFILLLCRKGHVYLWHGSKSSEDSRSTARAAAKLMQERKSVECNVADVSAITMAEIEEGNEPDEFWEVLGGKKYYCSLANDPSKHQYQPRLFELSSATGIFTASEVLCPSRSEPKICPFPFLQEDLCFAKQPALFIVDGYYEVYVWEGWMLENDDDVRTGSGRQRWDRDRRLAMQTALLYAKEVGKRVSHRVYVVFAGLEPQSFKALFPYWNDLPDVARIQKQDGKQPNAKQLASDLLEQFTKDFYTLEELKKIPPPQGVDPAKLEAYLSDSDFMDIFKMEKEEFNKLPVWKQQNLKRPVGLF